MNDLERENIELKVERERLKLQADRSKEIAVEMRERLKTLSESLQIRCSDQTSSTVEQRLLALVQMHRQEVQRLRAALIQSRGHLDNALRQTDGETLLEVASPPCSDRDTTNWLRLLSSAPPPGSVTRDNNETISPHMSTPTLSSEEISPASLASYTSEIGDWVMQSTSLSNSHVGGSIYPPSTASARGAAATPDSHTDTQALTLVLAQSTDFKEKIMCALLSDLVGGESNRVARFDLQDSLLYSNQTCSSTVRSQDLSSASILSKLLPSCCKKNFLVLG